MVALLGQDNTLRFSWMPDVPPRTTDRVLSGLLRFRSTCGHRAFNLATKTFMLAGLWPVSWHQVLSRHRRDTASAQTLRTRQ